MVVKLFWVLHIYYDWIMKLPLFNTFQTKLPVYIDMSAVVLYAIWLVAAIAGCIQWKLSQCDHENPTKTAKGE